MSILEIDNLSLRYPGAATPAVNGISLTLAEREILALVGESGCGKSSTLRMIAGLEYPQEGEIRYAGKLLNRPGYAVPPEERSIGMVFQDNALFPHLTVAENILFGLQNNGRERLSMLTELTGLRGLEERYPHQISGGQMQRVALARALAPEPELLLMDEPFNNLDIRIKRALLKDIASIIRATGTACLFITHEKEEAFILADRISVMREGRLLQTAIPRDIYSRPANTYVAEFFGRANLVPVDSVAEGFRSPFGLIPYSEQKSVADYPSRGFLIHRPWDIELESEEGFEAEIVETYFFGDYQEVRFRPLAYTGGSFKFFTHSMHPLRVGDRLRLGIDGARLSFCRE